MTELLELKVAPAALVYVIECDHGVKVGITIDSVERRVAEIGRATGLTPAVVRTYKMATRSRAWEVEQAAHWILRDSRTVGEWFHCHPFEACDAVAYADRMKWPSSLRILADVVVA